MKNRIQEIRKNQGLSGAQLAELIGTSQQQIQRLENGERKLSLDWMERIAKALKCEIRDLLNEGENYSAINKELLHTVIVSVLEILANNKLPAVPDATAKLILHLYDKLDKDADDAEIQNMKTLAEELIKFNN